MPSGLSEISPLPSKETVNKAGRKLAEWLYDSAVVIPDEEIDTLALHVYAWRAQHYGPLGLVMPMLREWSDRYSTSNIKPSQRLKRFRQMIDKLYRHPEMKLARMQDIGGARAVLANRDEVEYFKLASEVLALIDQDAPADKDLRERFAAAREQVRPYFTPKETS